VQVAGVEPDEASVLALDNVPLELPVAGTGNRVLAAFLDVLIVGLTLVLFLVAILALSVTTRLSGAWAVAVVLLGIFLIQYGYFAGVEIATGGRSFGKWALGLRVVTRQGGRPSVGAFLVRNVVRLVDVMIGVPVMAFDPLSRRLGDHLAGTLVVHGRPGPDERPLRIPRGWGGREVAVLESFLQRAPEMEASRVEALARQLLFCIERDDPALLAGIDQGDALGALRRAVEPPLA
jgi:uncharacterized RDD family membrane protein YckC